MNALRYGMAIGLLTTLGACSNSMREGGSGGASHAAAMTQPTIAPAMVKEVQSRLRDDGYYKKGSVDGLWGAGTESAVRSFQHDHNLSSNGQLDVPTLQALNITNSASSAAPTQPTGSNLSAPPSDTAPAPMPTPTPVNPNVTNPSLSPSVTDTPSNTAPR